jgi:ABC-type molybdate transport system substrate-binding protein
VRAGRWIAVAAAAAAIGSQAAEPVKVYAAGSLKAALAQAASEFSAKRGTPVSFEFGPSGLLRGRLAKGERADVFASANMEHPRSLAEAGLADPVRMFARNRLCALAPAKLGVTPQTLLARMLDPAIRLGTSTPRADPSGDYAWEAFERAEKVRPGAFAALSAKALKLTGGPDSPPPPKDRVVYGVLVSQGKADIFLTYCTNAIAAVREEPTLASIALPEELAVGAEYGLVTMKGASPAGAAFAEHLLGPEGQRVLAAAGFSAP